jgi:triphosphoribosyl-dephospho-CoA synthase
MNAPLSGVALRDAVARAFRYSCEAELRAPKPGNVHIFAPGHRMSARDFFASAQAAAEPLTQTGASVGARILNAVDATQALVGQNTNLGIILLCAPLAHAAQSGAGDLEARLEATLRGLGVDDADCAFRAIARANPAGLGVAAQHDVAATARTTLLEAMREAAPRDAIARQYAENFRDLFEIGAVALAEAAAQNCDAPMTTLRLYLSFLSKIPDSHIARKFGTDVAQAAMMEARARSGVFFAARRLPEIEAEALQYDADLKARGLNPGTSADLTVAAHFADCLRRILANAHKNG